MAELIKLSEESKTPMNVNINMNVDSKMIEDEIMKKLNASHEPKLVA